MDIETLLIQDIPAAATQAAYSVQAQHSKTGDVVREGHATMKAAVARAIALMQAGYSIEIWSPASLEEH
jgi:hypothetical protein